MAVNSEQIYRSDLTVIGSSPTALAYAIKNAKVGVKTIVVERESHLGGAWQIRELDCGARVEIACHLFEYYTGGYELLSKYSTVPFDVQEAQPFKLLTNGKERPYSTKSSILGEFLYLATGYVVVCAVTLLNALLPQRAKLMQQRTLDSSAWRTQLKFQYKQKVNRLYRFNGIRFPRGGVDVFVSGLAARFESLGGRIVVNECGLTLIRKDSSWKLLGRNGCAFESTRVAMTESARLEMFIGENSEFSLVPRYTTYWHLLVSLPSNQVRRAISYVHLPENPEFHRVTIIDVPRLERGRAYYLIQSRVAFEKYSDALDAAAGLLRKIGIIEAMTEVTIEAKFVQAFVQSKKDTDLPSGVELVGVEIIRSIGDVARNFCVNFGDEDNK